MEISSNVYGEIFDAFREGRRSLSDYSVEIVGGENAVPPIILLRAFEGKETLDDSMTLAQAFCADKDVVIRHNGAEVFRTTCTGGDLNKAFQNCPYYLDLLLKVAYGLMIKKLTPPSSSSVTAEQQ